MDTPRTGTLCCERSTSSGAALLVVALGSPKQEYWIRDHLHRLRDVKVAVGEGGSLDFIAGDFRRAPNWLQRVGLEWFWRLFMNRNKTGSVSRARRIWNAVPVFICRTVSWKLAAWVGLGRGDRTRHEEVAVLYSGGRHWGGIESYLANLFRLYDRAEIELLLFSLGDWELTRTVARAGLVSEVRLLSGKTAAVAHGL